MPYMWVGLMIMLAVLLQTSVVTFFQVGNARADLLLIITFSAGLIFGRTAGVSVGFFSGLLWDLLTAQFFGMNTLAKLIIGYIAGVFEKKVFKENPILPVVAAFLATFIHEIVLYICAYMLNIKAPILPLFGKIVLPTAIYNCLVGPFVYFAIYRFRSGLWLKGR